MNTSKSIITFLTLPVVTGTFFATAILSPVAAEKCNAETDLQGTVNKNEATVTNHATNTNCNYDATLAVYDSPKDPETIGWIEAQKLIGSKSVNVKAGETVSLKVEGTGLSCFNQSDLFRGTEVFTPPVYRTAMDTDVYKVNENACKTAVGSASATNTTVNATQLASTGGVIAVYAFILAGFVTLAAGMFLRKLGK